MIQSVWKNCIVTVLKSFLSNVYQRREGFRRAEDGEILIFTSSGRRQPSPRYKVLLKIDFKTVNTSLALILFVFSCIFDIQTNSQSGHEFVLDRYQTVQTTSDMIDISVLIWAEALQQLVFLLPESFRKVTQQDKNVRDSYLILRRGAPSPCYINICK